MLFTLKSEFTYFGVIDKERVTRFTLFERGTGPNPFTFCPLGHNTYVYVNTDVLSNTYLNFFILLYTGKLLNRCTGLLFNSVVILLPSVSRK